MIGRGDEVGDIVRFQHIFEDCVSECAHSVVVKPHDGGWSSVAIENNKFTDEKISELE